MSDLEPPTAASGRPPSPPSTDRPSTPSPSAPSSAGHRRLRLHAPDPRPARRLRARHRAARTSSCRRAPAPARPPPSGCPSSTRSSAASVAKVQALILTPTRELALQITRELERSRSSAARRSSASTAARRWGSRSSSSRRERRSSSARRARPRPPPPGDARPVERPHLRPRRGRRDALDGLRQGAPRHRSTPPQGAAGALLQRDHPAGHRAPGAVTAARTPSSSRSRRDQIGALEINHFVYLLRGGDKRAAAHSDPRGRGPRERDHLLQHEGRDRARRRGARSARATTPTGSTATSSSATASA